MKGIKSMIKAMNYILSHLQIKNRPIYITNHGRSGTSWIGTILGKAPGILFYNEPCNPKVVKGGEFSHWFRYVRPDGSDSYFESCLDHSFKGLIKYKRGWWLTEPYRRFLPGSRVLVKEVAALMSLEWVYKRYQPEVLFVLRHPCAVALSEMNKINREEKPIIEILKQPSLMDDHLNPYLTVLEKAKTPYEIFGALWGARNRVITNLIPKYPEWKIVFYEDFINDPFTCFRELFDHFKLTWTAKVEKYITQTTTIDKPGIATTHRVLKDQINKWKRKMTPAEVEQVRTFVVPFNLPYYNLESDWSLE